MAPRVLARSWQQGFGRSSASPLLESTMSIWDLRHGTFCKCAGACAFWASWGRGPCHFPKMLPQVQMQLAEGECIFHEHSLLLGWKKSKALHSSMIFSMATFTFKRVLTFRCTSSSGFMLASQSANSGLTKAAIWAALPFSFGSYFFVQKEKVPSFLYIAPQCPSTCKMPGYVANKLASLPRATQATCALSKGA